MQSNLINFFLVVNLGASIGIKECTNSFPIKSSSATVTKGSFKYTAKVDMTTWAVQITFDRAVKNVKVGKSGYSVKSGDKKTFTVKPKKNKQMAVGQTLDLPLTISYAK